MADVGRTKSINFMAQNSPYMKRSNIERYYFDRSDNLYSDSVSDLVCIINERSNGLAIERLSSVYDDIFIDEFQDLVGYDLDFIELMMKSSISVTAVGDPRQHTYSTNRSQRNKQFRGDGLVDWVRLRVANDGCILDEHTVSKRCNQVICDFASGLYPHLSPMEADGVLATEHDGLFLVGYDDVEAYAEAFAPVVLRYNRSTDTKSLLAMNIGVVKGYTYDRVLVFPTKKMLKYLPTSNLADVGDIPTFYVAVARAKYSVGLVTSSATATSLFGIRWSPNGLAHPVPT